MPSGMPGNLYHGDNLDVMRQHVATESVDLVYLDPPFNSDCTYKLISRDSPARAALAFVDTLQRA
jgi:16S rRNA G966 N2-methylase RsmD